MLDIDWCPHNDLVIASGSEDCTVMVRTRSIYEGSHELILVYYVCVLTEQQEFKLVINEVITNNSKNIFNDISDIFGACSHKRYNALFT